MIAELLALVSAALFAGAAPLWASSRSRRFHSDLQPELLKWVRRDEFARDLQLCRNATSHRASQDTTDGYLSIGAFIEAIHPTMPAT